MAKWKKKSASHTWQREVEHLSINLEPEPRQLLDATARCVDKLESQLQAKGELWNACGFGAEIATPIHDLSPTVMCDFLATHLLDVLVWSFIGEEPDTNLKFFTHPQWTCDSFHRAGGYSASFLGLEDKDVQKTFKDFLRLSVMLHPRYMPSPMPSASSVTETDDNNDGNEVLSSNETHPSRWENGDQILDHVHTAATAMNLYNTSLAYLASSNMWALTTSLLFVLNIREPNYVSRLKSALKYMTLDERVKTMLDDILDSAAKKTQKRVTIAAIALCHSPVFVLNPENNYSKVYISRFIQHSEPDKLVQSAFEYPPATSECSVAGEKAIWRHVTQIMAAVRRMEHAGSNLVAKSRSNSFDISLDGLCSELVKSTELNPTERQPSRQPWPFMIEAGEQSDDAHIIATLWKMGRAGSGLAEFSVVDIQLEELPTKLMKSSQPSPIRFEQSCQPRPSLTSAIGKHHININANGGGIDDSGFNENVPDNDSGTDEGREGCGSLDTLQDSPNSDFQKKGQSGNKRKYPRSGPNTRKKKKRGSDSGVTRKNKTSHLPLIPDTTDVARKHMMDPWVRSVVGSQFTWVPFTEIKLEGVEGLPPVEKESDPKILENYDRPVRINCPPSLGPQTLEDEVTVLRYVMLEDDSSIRRQFVTFPLTWPTGCEEYKKYAASLIANSRPATLQDYTTTTYVDEAHGAEETKDAPAVFSLSDLHCFETCGVGVEERWKWDKLLSKKPVMFIPQRRSSQVDALYDAPVLNLADIEGTYRLDVHTPHQVQDFRRYTVEHDGIEYFAAASIKDIIKGGRRAVNMLNVSNPTLSPPNIIQHVALDTVGGRLMEGAGFPANFMRWNLFATQPALTMLRYEAGRMATWIRCLKGTKIWFILDGPEGLAELDVERASFIYFVVEEGSVLFMPPGTHYAVLNATDCIAEGGHMFLGSALVKSLEVGLREHISGHQDANTSHISSESVLHSIWKYYYLAIENVMKDHHPMQFQRLRELVPLLPSLEDLVALIAMCIHPNAFEPSLPENSKSLQAPWSLYDQRISSRSYAKKVLQLTDLWELFTTLENRIEEWEQKNSKPAIDRLMDRSACRPL